MSEKRPVGYYILKTNAEAVKLLSQRTGIAQSILMDEAIVDLVEKYARHAVTETESRPRPPG